MELPKYLCIKCGHTWVPRHEPIMCPKCKTKKIVLQNDAYWRGDALLNRVHREKNDVTIHG